ncbi:MAG: tetratricopeptide repeat protein, partial [Acidobacteria bacterium]|nr:tetratricopeptide repeat protein [Acidobacteriota bacterium]
TTSLQRFTELVYARQKEVILGACAVAVLTLGFFGWRYYSSSRNASASTQLSLAINAFNDAAKPAKERYEKTIAEAQKTYDSYGSLPAGGIALYFLALSHEEMGDTAKAVQSLQVVIDRGQPDIKSVAQFALAGIHKKHGETQKAIDVYKQLYDSGGYSKAAVGYELASLYEANKQIDQAKDLYQKVVTEFPDSPFRQNADEALKRLGVTAPPPDPQKPS